MGRRGRPVPARPGRRVLDRGAGHHRGAGFDDLRPARLRGSRPSVAMPHPHAAHARRGAGMTVQDVQNVNVHELDKVGLTLLQKQLVNICEEMAFSMMRTAYSPIFSEGLDFSTLILDREGQLIANAPINPAMLGASLYAATWIINEVGHENFA